MFLVFYTNNLVFAQATISGRLINSDQEALVGATLSLEQNDSIIAVLSTDLDGYFCFKNLLEASYRLKGSYLGMQPIEQLILAKNKAIDLGRIETGGVQVPTIRVQDPTPFGREKVRKDTLQFGSTTEAHTDGNWKD